MNSLYKFNITGIDVYVAASSAKSAAEKVNKKYYPLVIVTKNDAKWCPRFIY